MSRGGSVSTQLEKPYAQQPATRAAAVRVLLERDAGDLIDVLGLSDEPPPPPTISYHMIGGRMVCSLCNRRVQGDGVCRRDDCGERGAP